MLSLWKRKTGRRLAGKKGKAEKFGPSFGNILYKCFLARL